MSPPSFYRYRIWGCPKESMKCLKKCEQPYSSGERSGCDLNIDTNPKDIHILVETEAAMSTFKPLLGRYYVLYCTTPIGHKSKTTDCIFVSQVVFAHWQLIHYLETNICPCVCISLVLAPPQLNITEEKDHLKLNWIPPIGGLCWRVEVCYRKCNLPQVSCEI